MAVIAAGCGGGNEHRKPVSVTPLVGWADSAVPELQAPDVALAPPCRASQLRAAKPGFVFQATASGGAGSVELRNAGDAACSLSGRPAVRFVGARRAPRQQQVELPPQGAQFPQVLRPQGWLRSIPPGGSASLSIDWRNWCVPGAGSAKRPLEPPDAVRVTLPAGRGSLDVDYNAVTTCERPEDPSTIGIRPFQPPPLPSGQPSTDATLTAKISALDGTGTTLHARRGQVLRYSVALRNEGSASAGFQRCPLVAQFLAPAGTVDAHPLNCKAAKPIAPRASQRFEMRLKVPANAPEGANGLFWELDPLGARTPQAVARVIVEP
jgi:hypothetical protein